jgi:hypothetical protein
VISADIGLKKPGSGFGLRRGRLFFSPFAAAGVGMHSSLYTVQIITYELGIMATDGRKEGLVLVMVWLHLSRSNPDSFTTLGLTRSFSW